ncbi:MAG: DUF1295 domain-containing protein [Planctomycetaceae bacterium]
MIGVLTDNALLLGTAVTVVWVVSIQLTRTDIIDVFWGPGFVLIAGATCFRYREQIRPQAVILVAAVSLWGLRLGTHLLIRWWNEPHEDRRYAAMRSAAGQSWWLRSLVTVFWLQAVILWMVSWPLQSALQSSRSAQPTVFAAGLLLCVIGFLFETVSDWQLTVFRRDPVHRNQVLDTGLWHYSRHPNYFGDFLVWWGLFMMSLALGAAWWTVVSPVVMSALLMKFSGVGMLEKDISDRRPEYSAYAARTNTFFPWFPKQ